MLLSLVGLVVYAVKNNLFDKKPAGLEINSAPVAKVYIDGVDRGPTPFSDKNMKPGQYTVKLIPEESSSSYSPYETKLNLITSATAVISRTFAAADSDSSGYIYELEEQPGGKSYLSVISDPDTANLIIDGVVKGYTPASKLELSPGVHELSLTSPGYKPLTLSPNILPEHNLIVKIKLGSDTIVLASPSPEPSPEASSSPSPSSSPTSSPMVSPKASSSPISLPYVIIEETETGWLRVRKEPSSQGDELGKADVGEKLKYLGETTEDGWHKIEFEGSPGWVSGKYASLVK